MYKLNFNPNYMVVMQHLESGDYLVNCGMEDIDSVIEAAWEEEKCYDWVRNSENKKAAKAEFTNTIAVYNASEVMQAHNDGYGWPIKFDLVTEKTVLVEKAVISQQGDIIGLVKVLPSCKKAFFAGFAVNDIHGGHNMVNGKMLKLSASKRNIQKAKYMNNMATMYKTNSGCVFYVL